MHLRLVQILPGISDIGKVCTNWKGNTQNHVSVLYIAMKVYIGQRKDARKNHVV